MIARALQWKPWPRRLIFLGLWTVIGLSFASQLYVSSAKVGLEMTWGKAIVSSLSDWYVFALLSIPSLALARRFPLERAAWLRTGAMHLAASLAFSSAYIFLRATLSHWQNAFLATPGSFEEAFSLLLFKSFAFNLWIYWGVIAVSHALDYYRKFHERELRASDLEKRLAQAKLKALQMQLNPHFLFNTLHTISALMHRDVEAADSMITKLSDLLRSALDSTDTHEVPLRQELDFLKQYLEIEQTRFRERLSVSMEIAPETMRAWVPNLILQPLVENAIRHGIEPHAKPGKLILRSARENGFLALEVRDNGGGLKQVEIEEGIGLSNTRTRLAELYGKSHQFELINAPEGGLIARVRIPFHERASLQ